MHCKSALVLSTLAIGQAAAVSIKHAGFHARRHEKEEKRTNYDVSGVDWNKALTGVNWASVFATPAAAAPTAAQKPADGQKAEVKATSAAAAVSAPAAYTPAAAAPSSAAASKPSSSASSGTGNIVSEATDLLNGVSSALSKFSVNMPSSGGATTDSSKSMYVGNGGNFKATFTNNKKEDMVLLCWEKAGMWLTATPPLIALKLGQGKSETLSFNSVSGGCGPLYGSTNFQYGMLWNTILEFTFSSSGGGFDVSRNVNMNGDYISAKGANSGCLSDNNNCVFKCKNGLDTCTNGADYDLFNKGPGCNGGYDAGAAGTGGSCEIHGGSETLTVSFS